MEPPTKMLIYKWYKLFDQTGCICKGKSPGRRPVTEAQVDTVCMAFVHSPHKSTRHAAQQLNMPHTTVHKILWKRLKFKRYKYQLLQHVIAQDKEVRYTSCSDFQDLKMMNFLSTTLSSVMKPHPVYQEMLIDITREYGGATILMKLLNIRETVQSYICQATHGSLTEHL
jgi:hypothetical protein